MLTHKSYFLLVLVISACDGGSDGSGPRPDCQRAYACQGSVCPAPLLEGAEGYYFRIQAYGGSYFIAEGLKISEVDSAGLRTVIGEFPMGPLSYLAVDDVAVYSAESGTIRAMDRATGAVRVVGEVAAGEVWSFGDSLAFVRADKSAWLIPKAGGDLTEVAPPGSLGWWRLAVVGDAILYSNVDGDVVEWSAGGSGIVVPHAEGVPDPSTGPDPEPWRAEDLVASASEIRFRDQQSRLYVASRDGATIRRVDTVVRAGALLVSGEQFAVGSTLEAYTWGDGEPSIFYRATSLELSMRELTFSDQAFTWFAGCTLTRAEVVL